MILQPCAVTLAANLQGHAFLVRAILPTIQLLTTIPHHESRPSTETSRRASCPFSDHLTKVDRSWFVCVYRLYGTMSLTLTPNAVPALAHSSNVTDCAIFASLSEFILVRTVLHTTPYHCTAHGYIHETASVEYGRQAEPSLEKGCAHGRTGTLLVLPLTFLT